MSGLGQENARVATLAVLENFELSESDHIVNVGICGASRDYLIGELIEFNTVSYQNRLYTLNQKEGKTLTCLDVEATESKYEIVDMESYGFYEATKGMKNAYIFKVVSDHFEPQTITKDKTKNLISNAIDEIMKRVNI